MSSAASPSFPPPSPAYPPVSAETPGAPDLDLGGLRPVPGAPASERRSRQRRLQRLDEAIARLSAHIQAATYRLLVMVRAFDEGEGWHEQGFRTCAAWLSWRTGLAPGAARERVRVARALADLPVLSGALERGELSYSAARALTRVARPGNEAELVEVARHTTAADLERLVRAWRAADRQAAAEADPEAEREKEAARHDGRELWLLPREDGSWWVRGRLDPEAGAALAAALEAAGEALFRRADPEADPPPPPEARRADALGLVAEAALGGGLVAPEDQDDDTQKPGAEEIGDEEKADSIGEAATAEAAEPGGAAAGEETGSQVSSAPVVGRADRYQVVVHVAAGTLAGVAPAAGPGVSAETPRLEGGPHLPAATARRLACDAGLVTMVHDEGGRVLDVGRRTRTVPTALRRALAWRDRGCRFPGCGARHCDAHHIIPWAEGGETKLENLVLLCRHHHRRVHEDGWRVELVTAGAGSGHEGDRSAGEARGAGGSGSDGAPAAGSGPPDVRVFRPDGRCMPRVPPAPELPTDPVGSLERRQRGLDLGAWTPTPRGTGEPLDVDLTLYTLWSPPPGLEG